VDVACGLERQRGLDIGLDIIPTLIPLDINSNLSVPYAASSTLTDAVISVSQQQLLVAHSFCYKSLGLIVIANCNFGIEFSITESGIKKSVIPGSHFGLKLP